MQAMIIVAPMKVQRLAARRTLVTTNGSGR
nr:MAG TPA: hypothetical protein [Caudoviricetes sp.]